MATSDKPWTFGYLLRRYRVAAGLSQEELAERAALSQRGISDLERGKRQLPHPATVRRLIDALDLVEGDRATLMTASHKNYEQRGRTTTAVAASPGTSVRLPVPLSTIIGREGDIARLSDVLQARRLL